MGSAIHHVGALGTDALAKLTTNTLLELQINVIAERIGMLEHAERGEALHDAPAVVAEADG